MGQELAGKVAIVTGGAGGIGRGDRRAASSKRAPRSSSPTSTPSAARRSPRSSARRPRSSRPTSPMPDQVQARRRLRGRALRRAARHVQQRRDRRPRAGASSTTTCDDFDALMRVNLFGVMVGCQRAARHMAEHGGGSIINTTSIGGINAGGGLMTYRATKAAVIHLTRCVAIDLAEHGIRVNCIAPAHIPTDINTSLRPGDDRAAHAAAATHRARRATSRTRCCTSPATGRRRSPGSCCRSTAGRPPDRPMVKLEDVRRRPRRRRRRSRDPWIRRPASTPATTTSISPRCRPTSGSRGCRARWPSVVPRVVTRDGRPSWVCEDRVMGRSGMPERARSRRASARSGAPASTTTASAPATRSCGSQDMDRDGLCGVGDLRTALARVPDRRPRAAGRVLRGVERLGGRGVQRGRARPAVRARVPARPLARGRRAELERCAALGHRGAIIGVFDIDLGDPAWDRLWAAAAAHRPADQLPHQGRHVVEAQLPDRQVAVGRVRDAAAAAARRAARDHGVLRRARAAPGPRARARGVGRRLAAVLPRRAWTSSGEALRDKLDYAPEIAPSELFRRQVVATFEEEPAGGAAHPARSAPTRACGPPTIRTPTARSRTRGARSRRRSARCPRDDRPQDHRDQLCPALRLRRMPCLTRVVAASTMCRCRCRTPTRWWRSTARSASTSRSTPHVVSVYVGDQMINFHRPATWPNERLHAAGTERAAAVRRSLLRVGRVTAAGLQARSTRPAPRSSRVRSRAKVVAGRRRRACTSATPTATCWSS